MDGQRDVHDARVEHDHEVAQAQHVERQPAGLDVGHRRSPRWEKVPSPSPRTGDYEIDRPPRRVESSAPQSRPPSDPPIPRPYRVPHEGALDRAGARARPGRGGTRATSSAGRPSSEPLDTLRRRARPGRLAVVPDQRVRRAARPGHRPAGDRSAAAPAKFKTGRLRLTASVPDGWRRVTLAGGSCVELRRPGEPDEHLPPPGRSRHQPDLAQRRPRQPDHRPRGRREQRRPRAPRDREPHRRRVHGDVPRRRPPAGDHGALAAADGTSQAYAAVATTGRETDRPGMADLLERVAASGTRSARRRSRGHLLYCHFTSLVCPVAPRPGAPLCRRHPAPALCRLLLGSSSGRATCAGRASA